MKSLLILGAGGHSKVIVDTVKSLYGSCSFAFLDDRFGDVSSSSTSFLGYPIIGNLACSFDHSVSSAYHTALVGIGDPLVRLDWIYKLLSIGYNVPSVCHPSAYVSSSSSLGSGSVVFAQAVLQPYAVCGAGVILNTACSVDHDSRLGDGVHIAPGAHIAADVLIGNRSWIGIGSSVRNGVSIGTDVTIGAGAAVVSDIPSNVIAIGVPARFAKISHSI